jgi:hypothetical protein
VQSLSVDTRLVDVTLKAREQEELEERLEELETTLEPQRESNRLHGY